MPQRIDKPSIIQAAGNKPKRIEEFIGRVNTKTHAMSVARMTSPAGWREPAQTPEFDEATLVLSGTLRVEGAQGAIDVQAGQAVLALAGETVRYSTPGAEGAEYVAVCTPAFSPDLVHRHEEGGSAEHAWPAANLPAGFSIVGRVRSPVIEPIDSGWGAVESVIELEPALYGATRGLEDFSHALIVCLLHRARYVPDRDRVRRPREMKEMPEVGIFAQRAKDRPNSLGISAVQIVAVTYERITVRGLDAVDGTPVLDIKPYFPAFDRVESPRVPAWVDRLMRGYF